VGRTVNVALTALLDCAGVVAADRVLVLVPADAGIGQRVCAAATARGASPRLLRSPDFPARLHDVPAELAGPLAAADVLLDLAGHESLVHTPTARRAVRQGTLRLVSVSLESPEDWASEFAEQPLGPLFERARAAAARLAPGGTGRIRTADGTDLRFRIAPGAVIGMPGGAQPGPLVRGQGGFCLFPPGAIGTAPQDAHGTVVLDGLLGFAGRLPEPVVLTVEGGFVTSVAGGAEADWLSARIAEHEHGGHVAKLLAGLHPAAPLAAGLAELDRKKARLSRAEGVVLVGLGDSLSVGGSVASSWHWDGVLLGPVWWSIDDRPLYVAGQLQVAPAGAVAAVDARTPPHTPVPILRAGELLALVVNACGPMQHTHRNPECDELWIALDGPTLEAELDGRRMPLAPGAALVVPRGVPHRVHGGKQPATLLVIERLPGRTAALPERTAPPQPMDLAALAERPTPHWTRPAAVLARAGSFVVEGYARPEGMLRPGARLSEPELWVCLRGGLAVGWEGREDAASAGPGGVLSVPAGGEARVVSTRPDTVALRVTAT
jgi:mannose-6-phosphate isomerase-like protein (cupin superfamily)